MKHKKTLVAIILCLVLIFGMFALVACGETDGNTPDGDNSNGGGRDSGTVEGILADYDAEILQNFENLFYKLFAYGQENYSYFYVAATVLSKEQCEFNDFYTAYGDGFIGAIRLCKITDPSASLLMQRVCEVYVYDSEESVPPQQEVSFPQYGNMLVDCIDKNLKFENILALSSDTAILLEEQQSFIDEIVNNALHSNKSYNAVTFEGQILNHHPNEQTEISGVLFKLQLSSSNIGNCYEEFYLLSQSIEHFDNFDIDDLKIGFDNHEYSDNSYLRLENDTYYAYAKNEPGFKYRENDNGYTLSKYCYEEIIENLTIPNEHKGKHLTCIGEYAFANLKELSIITIPKSIICIEDYAFYGIINLTSIVYEGTKAEWKAISKEGYFWNAETGNYTVHCTDGDLDKNGNEI